MSEENKQPDIKKKKTTLEDWNNYLHNQLKLPEELEIVNKRIKPEKENGYFRYVLVFLGLIALAGVFMYGFYYDKINLTSYCNENLTCGDTTCPANPQCPACNVDCGNLSCSFPKELKIEMNSTG